MKKQYLFLSLIACFSLTSGLCSTRSPSDTKYGHESTIVQTATDQMPFAEFTLSNYRVDGLEVAHLSSVAIESTSDAVKVNEDFTSCASCAPTKDVQFVDTSTSVSHSVTYTLDKRSIPELTFNYLEGRATEYRS